MEVLMSFLGWIGSNWDYILIAYLAGLGGNTNSGRWLVQLPVRPLAWTFNKLNK